MTDRLVKAPPTWKTTLSLLAGALALSVWVGSPALARVVEESGQEIAIRVSRGQTTEVVFSEAIRHVVTSLGKEALSLETAGRRLYLSPLADPIGGTLFVLLESDRSIALTLVSVSPPADRDVSVRIVSPAPAASPPAAASQGLTPLGLLRAMVLGEELAGVKTSKADREVYNDQAVRLTLRQLWRAPHLEGDVLITENLRATWIRFPIERIHFPGLLAIHAESEGLAPKPTTPEETLAARHRTRLFLIRVP